MKRTLLVAVAAALAMVVVDGAGVSSAGQAAPGIDASRIDPTLQRELAAAAPLRMVEAVVVLREQADLSAISARTRSQRLTAVERALRAKAAGTQKGVLALLHKRQAQQLVASVVPLWVVNEVVVRAAPSVIEELAARPDVREVLPNLTFEAPTPPAVAEGTATVGPPEPNVALVNAPALWNLGFHGQGTVVASMDTGVDATYPDLAGRWRGGSNSWYDPNGEHPTTPTDVNGHGTWTMGAIVGGDAGGTSIGVAPDAKWIAVKIFNDRGVATSTGIHRGFQWLLDPDGNPATVDAPNVVNDSWTMTVGGCNLDFQLDLRSLRAAGILPVFSAGNYGPSSGTVLSPANNPEAFAVGATDDSDVIDPSSSRGPSACAQAVAPKLVAPGVGVRTTDLYGLYAEVSGTSIAAPHVTGALALLLNAFPGLSADRQEAALESGAVDLGSSGADNDSGYGRLDALAAYQWLASTPDFTLAVSPSSVTTAPGGTASWTVSVAAVNGFAADVSLSLAGLSGSQATWSFSPPVVQGGSGTAQLTVTTDATLPPGTYPLTITGSSGQTAHGATATLVVPAPPDFSLGVSPSSRSVAAGAGAAYTVGVGSVNGFAGNVTLSLSGLPASVGSAAFTPAVVAGAGSSQLGIVTQATAPAGSYTLTVTGSSGPLVHSAQVTLVVNPAPDFGLSTSPSSRTVFRGGSTTYTVGVSSMGGFAGTVSLSLSGLPSGATASFTPSSVVAPGTSNLAIRAGGRTVRGTFTLTVTGQSGSRVHQATMTLIVK
jgi:subtilisin family serine protease